MNPKTSRLGTLLGTASVFTMATAMAAQAQQVAQAPVAQAMPEEVPEQVLITGSLIRGTTAVGVPVTNLSSQDFTQSGSLTTADLFRTVPAAITSPGPVATQSGANIERATRVNLRGLDTGDLTRSLLMVDGMRMPPQGNGVCTIDPSIIPQLALDRIDVLVDGASASYGSDAMAGVINVILKRGFDGAVTRLQYTHGAGGRTNYLASQLWGRTWDGGDITLTYEWYDNAPVYKPASNWTVNYSPWGLDNRIPLASSVPGTISLGKAAGGKGLPGNLGTNCTNCFAIPAGTGVPFPGGGGPGVGANGPAPTLMWNGTTFVTIGGSNPGAAGSFGTLGTANEIDPFDIGYFEAAQQRNAATMTIDQRLTKDITFSGEAFYDNRRAEFLNPSNLRPSASDITVQVPTWNPYYPTGAGVPTNIVINLNLGFEHPNFTKASEVAARYEGGFNIDLPFDWEGRIYYAESYDANQHKVVGTPNNSLLSAALGWTIAPSEGGGTVPGIAAFTKPGALPYLNLFCDPTAVAGCNSPDTLDYISGIAYVSQRYTINEKGATFDGPLYDLPGGQLKAAVGGTYSTFRMTVDNLDNTGGSAPLKTLVQSTDYRNVWAVFGQLNVPIFSDMNAIPFFQRLEIEASWRHDQYSDTGGTSNPKIAFNWEPHEWITIRGSWGTNFVSPGLGQLDPLANNAIQAWNTPVFPPNASSRIIVSCTADPASGAGKLVAGGAPCGPDVTLPGVSQLGSATVSVNAGLRDLANQNLRVLHPETSTNWGVGFDFAPTSTFLKGLDVQATWYQVKINGTLQSFGNPTTDAFSSGSKGFSYIVPSDLAPALTLQGNTADAAACAAANATPWTCPEFVNEVLGLLSDPKNPVPADLIPAPGNTNSAYWINDGGTVNQGWTKVNGIDFNASYDWDMGDLGAWNVGIVGTYYLHRYIVGASGGAVEDQMHTTLNEGQVNEAFGVESIPRLAYRARLGWSNGPWTATGFVNYHSHFFNTQSPPPNVNGDFCRSNGITPGGTLPCAIDNFSNIEPPFYTFDVALGYDTGDDPANDYLKHIAVQLVVQNIFDKHAAFEYRTSSGGGTPAAYDITASDAGRIFSVILTKTW